MVYVYAMSGICLVVAFTIVIIYYFSPKRKDDVEAAKYEMLNDYEHPVQDDEENDQK